MINIKNTQINNGKSSRSSANTESLIEGEICFNNKTTHSRASISIGEYNLCMSHNDSIPLNSSNIIHVQEVRNNNNSEMLKGDYKYTIEDLEDLKELINELYIMIDIKSTNQIQFLDLEKIEINQTTRAYINQLLSLDFPKLLELTLGNIKSNEIIFSGKMPKLKILNIGAINFISTVKFSESLIKLKSLTVKSIEEGVTLSFSGVVDALKDLTIGDIKTKATLDLSALCINAFENIRTGALLEGCTIAFPSRLSSLQSLSFGEYNVDVLLYLPKAFPNLTKLSLGDLKPGTQFALPAGMKYLQALSLGDVFYNASIKFSSELNELNYIKLGDVHENSNIEFPIQFENLINFTVGAIDSIRFKLPFMPSIKNLFMGDINPGVHIALDVALDDLATIDIGHINSGGIFDLSASSLPSLKQLKLGIVEFSGILKLDSLNQGLNIEFEGFQNKDLKKRICKRFPNAKQKIVVKKEKSNGSKNSDNCCLQ